MAQVSSQEKVNTEQALAASEKSGEVRINVQVPQEQIKYANLLLYGSWAGIAVLAVTFALYVFGVLPSYIDPAQMQQYWGMKSSAYLEAAKVPYGWGWLGMIGYGDFIPLIGMAWLGALTVIGYLILLPAYIKKKDVIYSTIVAVEVIVLVLAASGILGTGGH